MARCHTKDAARTPGVPFHVSWGLSIGNADVHAMLPLPLSLSPALAFSLSLSLSLSLALSLSLFRFPSLSLSQSLSFSLALSFSAPAGITGVGQDGPPGEMFATRSHRVPTNLVM